MRKIVDAIEAIAGKFPLDPKTGGEYPLGDVHLAAAPSPSGGKNVEFLIDMQQKDQLQ